MIRPIALAAAIAVSLLAVAGAESSDAQAPTGGGTVVVGTYLEPAYLNAYLERCGSSVSVVYPVTSRYYQPNWRQYRYGPIEVRRLLEREGCRRGAGGIYDCQGNRLSLRIATTAGIPRRQQTLEAIQRQLRPVGIKIVPVYVPGPILFNQVFASGDFDLVLFSYLRFRDSPGTSAVIYSCGGVQNIAAYCQRLVTRDLDQATRILDANQQARVLNRADAKLARDVPVLPLYHVPTTIAHSARVRGVGITAFFDPFVNAENWWLER